MLKDHAFLVDKFIYFIGTPWKAFIVHYKSLIRAKVVKNIAAFHTRETGN